MTNVKIVVPSSGFQTFRDVGGVKIDDEKLSFFIQGVGSLLEFEVSGLESIEIWKG